MKRSLGFVVLDSPFASVTYTGSPILSIPRTTIPASSLVEISATNVDSWGDESACQKFI